MRPAILFLDTNILLDCPRPEEYRLPGRRLTLVVIPEVMRELRGLAHSPDRGQVGAAGQALAALESLARRPGSAAGVRASREAKSTPIASWFSRRRQSRLGSKEPRWQWSPGTGGS
jgi:hypothetical protein